MASSLTIASEIELVPANCFEPLDFSEIFRREAPIEVDLGCGDGSFVAALAREKPARDFLGIDRLQGRVSSACRRIERASLTNVRITRFEISYAVEHLLPPVSIHSFYLLFPDPWPKRRHAGRRLVNRNFLVSLHRALVPGGAIHLATDDAEYFQQIGLAVSADGGFEIIAEPNWLLPSTKFERGFRERGVPIYRLELRKISPVT